MRCFKTEAMHRDMSVLAPSSTSTVRTARTSYACPALLVQAPAQTVHAEGIAGDAPAGLQDSARTARARRDSVMQRMITFNCCWPAQAGSVQHGETSKACVNVCLRSAGPAQCTLPGNAAHAPPLLVQAPAHTLPAEDIKTCACGFAGRCAKCAPPTPRQARCTHFAHWPSSLQAHVSPPACLLPVCWRLYLQQRCMRSFPGSAHCAGPADGPTHSPMDDITMQHTSNLRMRTCCCCCRHQRNHTC